MDDQNAQIAANSLSLIATQLEEMTKVLLSINEKLNRISLQGDRKAPGNLG